MYRRKNAEALVESYVPLQSVDNHRIALAGYLRGSRQRFHPAVLMAILMATVQYDEPVAGKPIDQKENAV